MRNLMTPRNESNELIDIKRSLVEIRLELKRLADSGGRAPIHGAKDDRAVDALMNQLFEEIDVGLENGMVPRCGMRETCKGVFTDLLQKSAGMAGSDSVSEETVRKYRSELEMRRKEAPRTQCTKCFEEVSDLFDKHVRVARSLRIYRTEEEVRRAIEDLREDVLLKEVLEPVSNRQRLQILKMLSSEARSFSYISEQSGLRGGNLLFHLQRLAEGGLIIQQYERGDYMLSEKGYTILRNLTELLSILESETATNIHGELRENESVAKVP